jgi:non-canonical (house-cleaning) NTP pyrophosphatase
MSIVHHDNKVFQTAANNSESVRQVAVDGAVKAGGSSATVAAAIKTAEAAYFRAVIASCVQNGIEAGVFRQGLYYLTGKWS